MRKRETVIYARISGAKQIEAILTGYKDPLSAMLRSLRLGRKKRKRGEPLFKAVRRTGIFRKIPGIELGLYDRHRQP